MIGFLRTAFRNVTYRCRACGVSQRIPLRRVHFFERFHELEAGEPVLIVCPHCSEDLQIPSAYRTHNGHHVSVDPHDPPQNAFIHGFY